MISLPEKLLENDADDDLVEGLRHYDAGDWEKSLNPLRRAATKGNVTAIFKLANSLDNLDREDEAIPLWEAAADWGHFGACNNFAIRLRKVGDLDGARELYRRSAQAGNAQAMFNLANSFDKNSETEDYVEWLQLAANSGMLRAQAILGDHFCQQGRHQEGMPLLEDAIQKGSLSAHILVARMDFQNDDYERAYLIANQALALPLIDDDKHLVPNAYFLRGLSGDHLGHKDEAINDVRIAREMGFDVSSAPFHLRTSVSGRKINSPSSSQAAKHYATLGFSTRK